VFVIVIIRNRVFLMIFEVYYRIVIYHIGGVQVSTGRGGSAASTSIYGSAGEAQFHADIRSVVEAEVLSG
jgi:hypothetical protein